MGIVLQARNLRKKYFREEVLSGINLELHQGRILGLVGPNGSGKTTFLKIVAGLNSPTEGEILLDGQPAGITTKRLVSFLPDVNPLPKWMEIKDAVEFFRDFFPDFAKSRCLELLEFMNLHPGLKISTMSKGTIEKLNLALVLARRARLYVLDEPIAGVDPLDREKIKQAIINSLHPECSMLITTHQVGDLENLFDEVAFLAKGQVVLKGDVETLRMEWGSGLDRMYRRVFSDAKAD
jgi:ABC-2 type transport system ATP-binding protein